MRIQVCWCASVYSFSREHVGVLKKNTYGASKDFLVMKRHLELPCKFYLNTLLNLKPDFFISRYVRLTISFILRSISFVNHNTLII